jgi:hypothetical protein
MRYLATVKLKHAKRLRKEVRVMTFPIVGDIFTEQITGVVEMKETFEKNNHPYNAKKIKVKVVVINFGKEFGSYVLPRKLVTITLDTTVPHHFK